MDKQSSDYSQKRVQLMSMQMSMSERDEVKLNSSIRKNVSQRSSNLQVQAALSDCFEKEQIGMQVNKQLKAIKESHSNSTENSNSRESAMQKKSKHEKEI